MTFTGSPQAITDDIGAFQNVGLRHFLIGGDGVDLSDTVERLVGFASTFMAKFV
jgi:hypothetical protein